MKFLIALMIVFLESFFGINYKPICTQVTKSIELFATFNLNQFLCETDTVELKKK